LWHEERESQQWEWKRKQWQEFDFLMTLLTWGTYPRTALTVDLNELLMNVLNCSIHFWYVCVSLQYNNAGDSFGHRHKLVFTNVTQREAFSELLDNRIHQIQTLKHISKIIVDSHLRPWNEPAWGWTNRLRIAERNAGKCLRPWQQCWVI
jgi:hypothetical protein